MRVFPEKPEWILVFSLVMTGSLDNFLPFSETAKTRMRTIKMLNFRGYMRAIASVVIASFGFFEGVNILLHYITGFLANDDFPLYLGMVLDHGVYWGLLVSGVLAYKNKSYAKHFALVLVTYWVYMHFHQLTWPLNKPGFFGNTGWSAWKRAIDIASVGVTYSIALYAAVFILYRENLTRRSSKDAENGAA